MQPSNLQQSLTQVISEMLAGNRSHFGAVGPGHYGVEVDNLVSDGAEFDLNLTFKSGVSYCCIELGCHIPLHSSCPNDAQCFSEVRDRLKKAGIENLP